MSKYYDKELPVTVHVTYGGRRSGVTYRETEKLINENKMLRDSWDDMFHKWEREVNKVGKAIRYLESYHNTNVCECDKENLLKLLKGDK